jgi:CrcB protein
MCVDCNTFELMTAVWIAALGAAGSLARWGLSSLVQRPMGSRFPLGTLVVNFAGAALIGAVMALFALRNQLDTRLRLALTAGFLGGFTTYSSFAWETFDLLERRLYGRAAAYVGLTVLLCLAACAGAAAAVRSLAG